jgi:hypothetical protein
MWHQPADAWIGIATATAVMIAITASAGDSLDPQDATDYPTLPRRFDQALYLYEVKASGGNTFRFCSSS